MGVQAPQLLTARGTNLPRTMRGRFLTVGNGVTNMGEGKAELTARHWRRTGGTAVSKEERRQGPGWSGHSTGWP